MSSEREAEARLQELGIAIIEEIPPEDEGESYRVKGKHMDSGSEFEVSGDRNRLNALNALIVMARASA